MQKSIYKKGLCILNFDLGRIQLNHNRHMNTNINLPLTISIHHQKNYYFYYYYYRKYKLYGDQLGEFECGYWGLKVSPWDLFQFQNDYHTDDISSEIYKWVLCSNYQLSSSQHCSVHLGHEMPQ